MTDETLGLWKQAQQNLQWLVGDPIKLSSGVKIDFSMFDFIVATSNFTPDDNTSDLKMLQKFWVTLFPYVENVIDNLNHYKLKFREIYGIEGETLKKFALQNLELQCYKEFMKDKLGNYVGENTAIITREGFRKYHAKFKENSDKEITKIKKREDAWLAKQEEKLKNIEDSRKKMAFAAKLL